VIAEYLSDITDAKISSIQDAHIQTGIPMTGETVEDAFRALRSGLDSVVSARLKSWQAAGQLLETRIGTKITQSEAALKEASGEMEALVSKLCEKAEAKLDVMLQTSLASVERSHEVATAPEREDSKSSGATTTRPATKRWDVFISHASEDKEGIAHPLAEALSRRGFAVWYDKFSLKLGDSLRESIDRGLEQSRYGVVILSKHFFEKRWPNKELSGLTALEVGGQKVILPVWHGVNFEDVVAYSPTLADLKAISTNEGLDSVVTAMEAVLNPPLPRTCTRSCKPPRKAFMSTAVHTADPPLQPGPSFN
jgi:hypothetical protein